MTSDSFSESQAAEIPSGAWLMRRLRGADQQSLQLQSEAIGPLGLAVLTAVVTIIFQIGMWMLDRFLGGAPSYVVMMMLMQSIMYPTIVVFGCVTVACLFRSGSLIRNFLVGVLMITPGLMALFVIGGLLHGVPSSEELGFITALISSLFFGIGVVATICQLWTRWTLVPLRLGDESIQRPGIGALIELTTISAVVCAIVMSTFKGSDTMLAALVYAAIGAVVGCAFISFLIAFLSKQSSIARKVFSILVPAIGVLMLCTVSAMSGFGWTASALNLIQIAVVSVYGTAVVLVSMWACLLWLKACGWQCVKRT